MLSETRCCLFETCLQKSKARAKTGHLYGKATGNDLCLKVGWTRVSVGSAKSVIWIDVDTHMASACRLYWGRTQQRSNDLSSEKKMPLILMPENSDPPHMSQCLWNCCPSAGPQSGWVQVSPCTDSLRGQPWTPGTPPHSATIPVGFYSLKLWWLFFLALEPWAWGPGVGLGFSLFRGGLHSWDIPIDFYSPHSDVGPAHSASLPLLPVSCVFFIISLLVGLLFS